MRLGIFSLLEIGAERWSGSRLFPGRAENNL